MYDYDAQNDMELTIHEGDIIEVTQTDVGEGWSEGTATRSGAERAAAVFSQLSASRQACACSTGRLNGKLGQFPANYVEPY